MSFSICLYVDDNFNDVKIDDFRMGRRISW